MSTDSRAVKPGEAFFALKGETFDGHDFLGAVAEAGAGLIVVSDEAKAQAFVAAQRLAAERPGMAMPGLLLVNDTLLALQQLAASYRDVLADAGCRVIAVAGSNGKTTTRNLIHTVLSAKLRGTQSPKSFNNHIGVPLTILSTRQGGLSPPASADQFVVVEVGTNHPGEIGALARIVRPDIAVVTSIGEEHMEFFGTLDGVASEEAAILKYVKPAPEGGVAIIEGGAKENYFQRLGLIPRDLEVIAYGPYSAGSALPFYDEPRIAEDGSGQTFTTAGGALRITLPLVGRHNAVNALAALCVGERMGVPAQAMAKALERVRPVEMRLDVRHLGSGANKITLLNDAYNANPTSVEGAVMTLRQFTLPSGGEGGGRRVAILGDMFELGTRAPDLHRGIGRMIGERDALTFVGEPDRSEPKIHLAVFIGRLSLFAAEALAKLWPQERIAAFPLWDDSVPAKVAALLNGGDVVLLKASRGMKLERLLPAIERKFAQGRGA